MYLVSICVPTFRRPEQLDRLLESISKLHVQKDVFDIEVLIADNDPNMTAKSIADKWEKSLRWNVQYEVEENAGIPFVRNRLVRMANQSEFIAFIDDDEVASPEWINALVESQIKYDADVVMGPVFPKYVVEPPQWIKSGGFHASGTFEDGPTVSELITWNVLIRRSLFEKFAISFEERMALTGGTDVLLGRELRERGIIFHWSSRAIVEEIVPAERCRIKWLLQRRYRFGSSWVLILRHLGDKRLRVKSIKNAFIKFIIGVLKIIQSVWVGKHAAVKGVGYICQGFGIISGIIGFSYKEYKQIHDEKGD